MDEINNNEPTIETANPEFAEKFSHFLSRTPTLYSKAPITFLSDRGITNALFDSFMEFLPNGAIISGGFALSVVNEDKNAKDVDFFFTSQKAFEETLELFKNPPEKAWAYKGYKTSEIKYDQNSRYVLLEHEKETRPKVQLLKMVWYDDAEHIIDSFDFTIIQFAFTNKEFVYNGASFMDLSRKRLVLHRMQFPASTLRRLIKYTQKGYYACPGSLVKICESIKEFNGSPDIDGLVYVD
jgi:hypothetical protein